MASYLISYDLRSPGQDYVGLIQAIKDVAEAWSHRLESTWIIKHAGPASAIRDALSPHLDANDKLLVVKLSGEGAWTGIPADGTRWLKDNL